jgi:hypothetical protein
MSYHLVKPPPGTQLNYSHPLSVGLVGCWLFNEGAGTTALDSSGQGNHGTLTNFSNPPTATSGWCAGPNGGALAYPVAANSACCMAKMPVGLVLPLTYCFRCIPTIVSGDGNQHVYINLGRGGDHVECAIGSNQVHVYNGSFLYQTGTVSIGSSYLIAVVINANGNGSIWVNNKAASGAIGTAALGSFICIGNLSDSGGYCANGNISDVMIWNRALSAQEVSWLYAEPYCMFAGGDTSDLLTSYVKAPTGGRLFL